MFPIILQIIAPLLVPARLRVSRNKVLPSDLGRFRTLMMLDKKCLVSANSSLSGYLPNSTWKRGIAYYTDPGGIGAGNRGWYGARSHTTLRFCFYFVDYFLYKQKRRAGRQLLFNELFSVSLFRCASPEFQRRQELISTNIYSWTDALVS